MSDLHYRFRARRRTAAEWTALDEVLLEGEWGIETDLLPGGVKAKLGDGVTAWSALGYAVDTTSSGGVTDHGALTGLTDDDHPQYLNNARGDARYDALGAAAAAAAASDPAGAAAAAQSAAIAAAATDATTKANAAQAFAIQRSNHTGSQAQSTITGLVSDLAAKADLVGGLIPTAQIPAIAITEYLGSVGSQAAMLALSGQKGDWAIRTDLGTVWFITGNDPTQLADWTALSYPTAPVTSVNGQVGVITLAASDVGAQPVDATLTALAGANWAANAFPIGSGADTLSQVSFAANTFPGRGSSGNLVAKTISDDALAFVAAANNAAMRTALGATTVGGNLFTLANPSAISFITINADNSVTARSATNFRGDLGLGTAATQNTGTSGATVPLLSTANTWSLIQAFTAGIKSVAGAVMSMVATAPAQTASAQAGIAATITASDAVAGSSNAGAAAGGSVTITAGAAAQLTSGNANGGDINLVTGAGIGTGTAGQVLHPGGSLARPGISFAADTDSGFYELAAGTVRFAVDGVQQFAASASSVNFTTALAGNSANCSLSAFKTTITARTSDATDDGSTSYAWCNNTGATALITRTLPATPTALIVNYVVTDADGVKLLCASGDTIRCLDKITAGTGYLQSTTIGSYVTLLGMSASEWFVVNIGGVWTDGTFTYDDTGLTTP